MGIASLPLWRPALVIGIVQAALCQQWTHLDPDNATPWLAALGQATERHDTAGAEEALYRMSVASRDDVGWGAMPAVILGSSTNDDSDLPGITGLLTGMIGVQAATALPSYQGLLRMCGAKAVLDSNRQQVCAQVADVMAEHSDTLMSRTIGIALGRRSGWPPDRSDRMQGEYQAYSASLYGRQRESDSGTGVGLSCADMRYDIERMRQVSRHGEVGVLNDWVAQSGKTPEDHLELGRRRRLARERAEGNAAAASASSSSAASP